MFYNVSHCSSPLYGLAAQTQHKSPTEKQTQILHLTSHFKGRHQSDVLKHAVRQWLLTELVETHSVCNQRRHASHYLDALGNWADGTARWHRARPPCLHDPLTTFRSAILLHRAAAAPPAPR